MRSTARTSSIRVVRAIIWPVVFLITSTSRLIGQVPDTIHRPAVVTGEVVDSGGTRLAGVEILVLTGDTPVVSPTLSDSQGKFTFRQVPAGGPYTLIARKLGYKPSRGRGIQVPAGDTLRLRFVLNQLVVALAPITVKGRRDRNSLFADEIAAKGKTYRDLLDIVAWRKPYMLGDPYACSPLDSLGNPIRDEPRIRVTRNLIFGPGQGGGTPDSTGRIGHNKDRPADQIRLWNGIDEPALPFVRHVYVNGMQVDIPNDPIHTPARMLRAIPMRYVAEMHYADCWNQTVRLDMQYSLFVTLKPLPKEQADSIYRFILAQAAAAGPVGGRVLSVKHPNRQVWDSLVRLLTGRDTLPSDTAASASSP